MEYLKVVDWDKWQSYRNDRGTPPWIKVHRNLLTNPEWAKLSDSEKGQLVSIWIVAADKKGRVYNDAKILQKMCILDKPPNLNKLITLGFLSTMGRQRDANMTTTCLPGDAPETETETETETEKHIAHFENLWKRYPNKFGKKAAQRHFNASCKNFDDFEDIEKALHNYKAYVGKIRLNGHPDRQYQHGSTWFNNWHDWIDPQCEEPEDETMKALKKIEAERIAKEQG